jgi:hypothetical protein
MSVFTFGDLARKFGVPRWKVQRLAERGLLPCADKRVGLFRVVEDSDVSKVREALIAANYLRLATDIAAGGAQ